MSVRIDLPVDELVAGYKAGESVRKLARAYNVGHVVVWRRVRAAGVKMRPRNFRRGGPFYTDSKGHIRTHDRDGKQCYIARGCYEAHNGSIPNRHIIHHKNGNTFDNAIENLACMTRSEHCSLHNAG